MDKFRLFKSLFLFLLFGFLMVLPLLNRPENMYDTTLFSAGQPAKLALRQGNRVQTLGIETNPLQFSVSADCQLVLATETDEEGPYVLIRNVETSDQQILHAVENFGDSEVSSFVSPSVSPTKNSFAVVGIKMGSIQNLYMSLNHRSGTVVARWVDFTVEELRWVDDDTIVMKMTDGVNRPIHYDMATYTGTKDLKVEPVSETYFLSLPPSEVEVPQEKLDGAHRAILCTSPKAE